MTNVQDNETPPIDADDPAQRLAFLESQLELRDREIAILSKELSEKREIIHDLSEPHLHREKMLAGELHELKKDLRDSGQQLQAMTDAIQDAKMLIDQLSSENRMLADKLRFTQGQVSEAMRQGFMGPRKQQKDQVARAGILVGGFLLLGLVPWVISLSIDGFKATYAHFVHEPNPETMERSKPLTLSQEPVTIKATPNASPTSTTSGDNDTALPSTLVAIRKEAPQSAIENLLRNIGNTMFEKNSLPQAAFSAHYPEDSPPLAILRAKLRNATLEKMRRVTPPDGVILLATEGTSSDLKINFSSLSKLMEEANILTGNPCTPEKLGTTPFKRVTIVFQNQQKSLDCLNHFVASSFIKSVTKEITLINLRNTPQFSASLSTDSAFASYQEWNPEWLRSNSIFSKQILEKNPSSEYLLATILQSMSAVSEFKVDIPFKNSHVILGSFVLVPSMFSNESITIRTQSEDEMKKLEFEAEPHLRSVLMSGTDSNLNLVKEYAQEQGVSNP